MRKSVLYFAFFVLSITSSVYVVAQKDYTSLVNPFIGTGGHGHTYPGASMPFGMMQLSPDTRGPDWDGSSGYHYSDSVIYGFSHTHLSGTGIPDYCDVLFMPFTGDVQWNSKDYRSAFSHTNEKASPGYYEVKLDKNNIQAQLTTSIRSGMHQYRFPSDAKEGSVLIDLKWRDEVLDASIEKINEHEIRGYRRSRSWARDQTVYFYIRFEQPIKEFLLAENDQPVSGTQKNAKNLKAAIKFKLSSNQMIRCKVGISGVSTDGAKRNLDSEITNWDFNKIRAQAKAAWNKELSKIDVSGGSKDQQTVFYTALYHTSLVPNIYQDVDGQFRGTDLKIHQANGFTNYSVFSLWDTYRAYHPLMTIINQKRTTDWVKTFLKQYEYGGMLPVWELSGNETFCMIGYHSVPVIVDAFQKGIMKDGASACLKAMTSYAESDRYGLPFYMEHGYLSNDAEHESVSKTLEYAYDDWCIAQMAKIAGVDSVYKKYLQRSQNYKNMFDPQTHNMRGKVQAMWYSPFEPREINNFFTEGNSWQYTFAAPQDITTLIRLHGGESSFAEKLNELFTTSSQTTGRQQSDVTGLIGQYAQGNEPSHHMAYLFNYAHMPWRTQEIIQKICTEFYRNDPDGLIGNEDCGQMSAWYVLSAMGLYQVCPGNGEYVLGIPQFDDIKIRLENGKTISIRASKRSKGINYVAAYKLNGRDYNKSFITHKDLLNSSGFEFVLDQNPNVKNNTAEKIAPVSEVTEELIVPVPYFDATSNKFKDQISVAIKSIDPGAEIYYALVSEGVNKARLYKSPILMDSSGVIVAFAKKGNKQSKLVYQRFFKVPSDKSITVLSKVHSMYTAGGPDALIDGIKGSTNWRTGEWQSYFDQDFEAIVDLQKTTVVQYVGIHVLQDISPWIMYPKELIIYTSDDGKKFTEAGRVVNKRAQGLESVETQELGMALNLQARYIKLKAVNGGKLPAWHESAGNPSHLFIDEVIVR